MFWPETDRTFLISARSAPGLPVIQKSSVANPWAFLAAATAWPDARSALSSDFSSRLIGEKFSALIVSAILSLLF